MVNVGIDLNKVYEYKIYVKTSDYEKNVISDEYNQISLIWRGCNEIIHKRKSVFLGR